ARSPERRGAERGEPRSLASATGRRTGARTLGRSMHFGTVTRMGWQTTSARASKRLENLASSARVPIAATRGQRVLCSAMHSA
ncbi:unnamed protein product, partial [Polarella glacialis]